jgi:hypothetical protein
LDFENRDGEGIPLPALDRHDRPGQPTARTARVRELRC